MLVFIAPVRHPNNSVNYERVEALLKRTLQSVCNQLDKNFQVIIVCNQLPKFSHLFPKVDFVTVNFPPPSTKRGEKVNIDEVRLDKGAKYFTGLLHARKYTPDYVMLFDADDLVSNRLSEYAKYHSGENGWFISQGYIYEENGLFIKKLFNFNKKCGSSHLINFKLFDLPEDFPSEISQSLILDKVDKEFLKMILGSHYQTSDFFHKKGYPLKPLPFPGAVWIVGTGENHSGKFMMSPGHPVGEKIKIEFGLEIPNFSPRIIRICLFALPTFALKVFSKILKKLSIS